MKSTRPVGLVLLPFAVLYGIVVFSLDGRSFTQFYERSPYHRHQAAALLQEHSYLGDSVTGLQPGLVWHNGHVQHVWGLGIGFWLLPFQACWRLFGGQAVPDRFVLGIAAALLAYYAGRTASRLAKGGESTTGLALVWLVLLCPALWTLGRSSRLAFEDTVLYATLLSLGVFISIIRVALFGSRADYFSCSALSSFTIWVRPTHAIYGLSALVLSSLMVWAHQRSVRDVVLGVGGWLASLALLAWSNNVRFGSPTEFGHHMTVSTGSMMYLTRFGNPFQEAPLFQAAKEEFGLLFCTEPRGAGAFATDLFAGQAPFTRWRKLDLTTFDPTYALLCGLGGIGATAWLAGKKKKEASRLQQPKPALVASTLLWSTASMAALGWFYLYYPAMASRYLVDFAPACVGLVFLVWVLLPVPSPKLAWPCLAVWLVYEITSAKVPVEAQHLEHLPIQHSLPHAQRTSLRDFGGVYTADHHPAATGIACNGYGWEPQTGFAADVVSLVIDKPDFVELSVSDRRVFAGHNARRDVYRAQIDGVSLALRQVTNADDEVKVRFDVPASILARHRDEVLFLCFSDGYDADDRNSERFLYCVRWR